MHNIYSDEYHEQFSPKCLLKTTLWEAPASQIPALHGISEKTKIEKYLQAPFQRYFFLLLFLVKKI